MKIALIFLLLVSSACFAKELVFVSALGSKVYFAPPDTTLWGLEKNEMSETGKYIVEFVHVPVQDSIGREIQPVVAFIIESVEDSCDVIVYSIRKRSQTPFKVEKVLSYEDGHFSYPNAIGYEGSYTKGEITHRVIIAHMRQGSIGLQVICDSTEGIYHQVESDMRTFIYSIGIDQ